MMSQADKDAIRLMGEQFDPDIHCAENGCNTSISFKTHWLFNCPRTNHLDGKSNTIGLFAGSTMSRVQAYEWWLERRKFPWYCTQHDA
jgi:hypothetical protein